MTKVRLCRRPTSKPVTYATIKNPLLSRPGPSFNGTQRPTQTMWWATGMDDIYSLSHTFKESFGFMKSCAVCHDKFVLSKPFRCSVCRTVVHCHCISEIKSPCIPCSSISWKETHRKPLADYCPSQSPRIARSVIFALSARPSSTVFSTGTYIGCKNGIVSVTPSQAKSQLIKFFISLRDPVVPRTSVEPLLSWIENGNARRLKAEVMEMPAPHKHTLSFVVLWIKMHPGNRTQYSQEIVRHSEHAKIFSSLVDLPIHFWKNILTP